MAEIDETVKDAVEHAENGSRLNSAVAILVAITATLMALCHIKDGNIVLRMEHDQAKAVDTWNFYQAKSSKQHFMEYGLEQTQLRLQTDPGLNPEARQKVEQLARKYETEAKRYDTEKAEIKQKAEGYEADYDRWNMHHDQFDVADAFFSIAIAMFGITALTRRKWLFWVAFGLTVAGAVFGVAAFMQWSVYPHVLVRLLGA